MAGKTVVASAATFDELISGDKPVLVDFWAEWCGPCKAIAPALEQIAEEHDDFVIAKCDVDAEGNKELMQRYGFQSIPTLILFEDGEELTRIVGARPKQGILDAVLPLV